MGSSGWLRPARFARFKGNGGGFCRPSLAMAQNRLLATRIIGFAVSILGCVAPAPVAVLAAFGDPGRLGWPRLHSYAGDGAVIRIDLLSMLLRRYALVLARSPR